MKEITNKVSKFFYLVLLVGVLMAGLFYYWTFIPYNPITINNAPVPIRPVSLASGTDTTVIATLKSCKHTTVTPIVTRTLIGEGVEITTPSYSGVINGPGCQTLQQAIIMPQFTPPGTYHIHWHVAYQMNPIRTVVVQYDSENFTVTKAAIQ